MTDSMAPSPEAGEDSSMPMSEGGPDAPATDAPTADALTADAPTADGPTTDAPTDGPPAPSCDAGITCSTPSACPTPSTDCVLATCTASCCGTTNAAQGTACKDHGGTVCDGKGSCVACNGPSDCPAQTTACVLDTCTSNTCGTSFAAAGTACTDNGGTNCTASGTCANQCMDGIKDGNETDTDCGGSCTPCAVGKACMVDTDCATAACDATTFLCDANQCMDGRQDGQETGVDCGGGTCPACAVGQGCKVDGDCTSNGCDTVTGQCVSSQCTDQTQDGVETDVDCGGGTCPACGLGKDCGFDADCTSGACNWCVTPHSCISNQCADCQKDGAETDVDCGGGTCAACALGKHCNIDPDCATDACDGISLLCDANQCSDNRQDGAETDVDCGGSTCTSRCANGKKCLIDSDCVSQACDAIAHVCDASQCTDHQQDGNETDVDCGGGTCPPCVVGKDCLSNPDCASNACDDVTGKCVSSECADQKQDGTETDVDCGGGTCPTCALNKKCLTDSDCTSNACDAISLTCVANQCADGRKDGSETDVDCGGGICPTCSLGLHCVGDSDCASNACDAISLTCVSNQCNDHRLDGPESDVDCGGVVCNPCLTGQRCNTSFDCQAGHPCNSSTHTCE
jgi:hypothetical protein